MNEPISEPGNRSYNAMILFLFVVLPMPLCLFVYHIILWFVEQIAITSLSTKSLAWAGPIGLLVQGIVMAGACALLWRFTTDERFKPVYACLTGAALFAFPALILRALGTNNDQIGSILQLILATFGTLVVL